MNDEPTEWSELTNVLTLLQTYHGTKLPWFVTTPCLTCTTTQYYKVYPKYYYDTAAMARGLAPNESSSLKNVERVSLMINNA